MKYTKEQKIDIGRQVAANEISRVEAAVKYNISYNTTDNYKKMYQESIGVPVESRPQPEPAPKEDIEAYMAMTKEQLIDELIKAKANELRAKKGYEVKGAGAQKEFISLNSRNTKS